ncbi:MAG: universal stress protein [Candidatus Binatia bacterium]
MITIKKILVPTDFSDLSVPAVGYAISLAKKNAAEVTVLHVFPTKAMQEYFSERYVTDGLVTATGVRRQPSFDSIIEKKKWILNNFLQQNVGPKVLKGVKINSLVRFGKAVKEIVAAAKEEQSDLIVMTSRGSNLARLFGGTVTDRIARRAPCPVLSIQPSAEVRTEEDRRVPIAFIDKWAA